VTLPESLLEASPAAKLAYRTLEREGELTKQELVEDMALHRNTVARALETLQCHDLVDVRESTRDARRQIYVLE